MRERESERDKERQIERYREKDRKEYLVNGHNFVDTTNRERVTKHTR